MGQSADVATRNYEKRTRWGEQNRASGSRYAGNAKRPRNLSTAVCVSIWAYKMLLRNQLILQALVDFCRVGAELQRQVRNVFAVNNQDIRIFVLQAGNSFLPCMAVTNRIPVDDVFGGER